MIADGIRPNTTLESRVTLWSSAAGTAQAGGDWRDAFANAGHPPPLVATREHEYFLQHAPADLPLGIFANYRAADYVVKLPPDALLVLYTDGITEHARDPVSGEIELLSAARIVRARPELNAARAIARRVFGRDRGTDDAAVIALRTQSRLA